MDWADKLAENIARRGKLPDNHFGNYVGESVKDIAESLRHNTQTMMESNIKRWEEDAIRADKKWTPEKKEKEKKKETLRLAALEEEYDAAEEVKFAYAQKGIKIEPVYHGQPGKINKVKIPFTSEEWADVLNKEGEHLQACCASVSRIRDILEWAIRDDHFVDTEKLWEAAGLAKSHGWTAKGKDPISRLISLWESVEKDAKTRKVDWSSGANDAKGALDMLVESAGNIDWHEIWGKSDTIPDMEFMHHASRQRALATLMAAVRTLYFKMQDLDAGPVSGWGLWHDNGKIGIAKTGVALFLTKKQAEEICETWNTHAQKDWERSQKSFKKKQQPDHYTVKPTRISMENGVELIEEKDIKPFKFKKKKKHKIVKWEEID